MGFKCGIVGLPNVGKSTLFNALTKATIAAENYPFCTIDPNVGVVPVPDATARRARGHRQAAEGHPHHHAVRGHRRSGGRRLQGRGAGQQVPRQHPRDRRHRPRGALLRERRRGARLGRVDPLRDIEIINTELALADLESVEKALDRAARQAKTGDKKVLARKALLERVRDHLDAGKPVRAMALSEDEGMELRDLFLLTAKPTMYIANVDEDGFEDNPLLDAVRGLAQDEGSEVVPVCAAIEAEIVELEADEREMFLADLGLDEPGLNRVVRAGYRLLGLETYFTAGPKEVRAWTIPQDATAPQAAGVIHTDFERGFIRAEVIAYDDFVACKGEQGAREAGKLRSEGKDYVVRDGDVIHFRFNV